jgi:prolyl 4-hydroxylase
MRLCSSSCLLLLLTLIYSNSCQALLTPALPPQAVEQAARNLLSICGHLQDDSLYSAQWADCLRILHPATAAESVSITVSRKSRLGDILSLYPVQSLRLKDHTTQQAQVFSLSGRVKDDDTQKLSPKTATSCEIQVDLRNDPPLPIWNVDQQELFVDINIDESSLLLLIQPTEGWRAHLVVMGNTADGQVSSTKTNCQIISIPGAAPLCALVATKTIKKGAKLVVLRSTKNQQQQSETVDESLLKTTMSQRYAMELAELRRTLNLAYSTIPTTSDDDDTTTQNNKQQLLHPFYEINSQYPRLRSLHADPNIYVVDDFLSDQETDFLMNYARPNLRPCQVKVMDDDDTGGGRVTVDQSSRTSWDANVAQRDAPFLVEKLTRLAHCRPEQLETFQVLHYAPGQQFQPHTDGFSGPATACGFENSGRMVTVFCYLNSSSSQRGGGETAFPALDLTIRPQKGMAVLHFPTTLGLEDDPRTVHAGLPPMDGEEKWLLVTWVWRDAKSDDPRFDETLIVSQDDPSSSSS